jgi:HAD superfamily hydrolase (TIGR01509 family)
LALFLDFDGTLFDTESPDLLAWQELFAEHDVSLSLDLWYRCIGAGADALDVCAHLEELVGRRIVRDEVQARHRGRFLELVARERLRDGVARWLGDADRLGLALAIASSSSRTWVEEHLERLSLLERFRCVRCREDVDRAKPAPDLYISALQGLGVVAEEAVAIEDSPNGLAAAKAAGLYCIAVSNEVTRGLSFHRADMLVDSLAELDLEELLTTVTKRVSREAGK